MIGLLSIFIFGQVSTLNIKAYHIFPFIKETILILINNLRRIYLRAKHSPPEKKTPMGLLAPSMPHAILFFIVPTAITIHQGPTVENTLLWTRSLLSAMTHFGFSWVKSTQMLPTQGPKKWKRHCYHIPAPSETFSSPRGKQGTDHIMLSQMTEAN